MRLHGTEVAIWSLAVLCLGVGGVSTLGAINRMPPFSVAALPVVRVDASSQESARGDRWLAEHDPFRVARHPSPVAYRAEMEGVAPPPPPPRPPNPVLALAGILGGPPWEALLDGIPDHPGATVVREGDVVAGLRIRAVRRDSVVVESRDTTWRLGIRRSWQ